LKNSAAESVFDYLGIEFLQNIPFSIYSPSLSLSLSLSPDTQLATLYNNMSEFVFRRQLSSLWKSTVESFKTIMFPPMGGVVTSREALSKMTQDFNVCVHKLWIHCYNLFLNTLFSFVGIKNVFLE
jgi:hypothetical protein